MMKSKQDILRERAATLAAQPARSDRVTVFQVICFSVGGENYAIDEIYVKEVCISSRITPIPCTPEWLAGVVNRHGKIVGLIDFRKLFKNPEEKPNSHIIIIQIDDFEFGILSEAIIGQRQVFEDELQTAEVTEILNTPPKWLKAITRDGLIILDCEAMRNDKCIQVNDVPRKE
jgi:purine-binding chemotaxis protein CheW